MSYLHNTGRKQIRSLREAEEFLQITPDDRLAVGAVTEKGYEDLTMTAVKAATQLRESIGTPVTPRIARAGARPLRDWLDRCRKAASMLRESNGEAALGFLMRKGISLICNDWYNATEAQWVKYARVEGSTTVAEWYGPMYGSTIPGPVGRGGQFPEGRMVGEESSLVNVKFGLVEGFERELFDDDQTSQVKMRAERLGAGMRVLESIWTSYRLIGTARTYANVTVPASRYATVDINGTTVNGPFSTSLFGSYGNRPSSYAALSMNAIKTAYTTQLKALDPLQNIIAVVPNVLVVSARDSINAQILLAPGMYPAVLGPAGDTLGGVTQAAEGIKSGFPGAWGSQNPLAGLGIELVTERYLPDWAWLLGEKGKGFIFQERDPLEIVQETPNSGISFAFDTIRFRSRRRFEADYVGGGSRFWYLGNDGTATGEN